MEESTPGWFYPVVFGLMPATMLLLWILTYLPLSDAVSDWLAGNGFTYIFIAAGVGTGLLMWYGASNYW